MTITARTYAEAAKLANLLRELYARDGWRVSIARPLFSGDLYRVNVN